jgi:hypothetical protein
MLVIHLRNFRLLNGRLFISLCVVGGVWRPQRELHPHQPLQAEGPLDDRHVVQQVVEHPQVPPRRDQPPRVDAEEPPRQRNLQSSLGHHGAGVSRIKDKRLDRW